MTKTYNVGRLPDGTEVQVEDIHDFWETASEEVKNGARFNIQSYGMICYDQLPVEIRETLQTTNDDHNSIEIWQLLYERNWLLYEVVDYIKKLDGPKNHK